jgi:uncharacterized protein
MSPTIANGKICYVEIPVTDIALSADFYSRVFNWKIRKRGDGATAFDDGVGEVSGAFVVGRPAMSTVGLLIYVMVDSVVATLESIVTNGGEIVQPIGSMHLRLRRGFGTWREMYWGSIKSLLDSLFQQQNEKALKRRASFVSLRCVSTSVEMSRSYRPRPGFRQ